MLQGRLEAIEKVVSEIEEEFGKVKEKREDLKKVAYEVGIKTGEARDVKLVCEETMNRIVPSLN